MEMVLVRANILCKLCFISYRRGRKGEVKLALKFTNEISKVLWDSGHSILSQKVRSQDADNTDNRHRYAHTHTCSFFPI